MQARRRNQFLAVAVGATALLILVLVKTCSPPAGMRDDMFSASAGSAAAGCAHSRELFVRIERASPVDDKKLGLDPPAAALTLAPIEAVFATAGVRIRFVVPREKRFSASASRAVPWSDLHGILLKVQAIARGDREQPAGCERDVSVLVVPEGEKGRYGLMFDYGTSRADGIPRQGLAIFFGSLDRANRGDLKQFFQRVLAHELLHVLNVHHQDWCCRPQSVIYQFAGSLEGGDWRIAPGSPGWIIGDATRDHIALSPIEFVMPGPGSVPFSCVTTEHRTKHARDPAPDDSQVPREPTASGIRECRTKDPESGSALPLAHPVSANRMGAALSAHLERAVVKLGEPFQIRAELTNWGKDTIRIPSTLEPESGGVVVLVERPGGSGYERYFPPVRVDGFDMEAELRAREKLTSHFAAFFGSSGWTLKQPGKYRVQLLSRARQNDEQVMLASNVLEFTAVEASLQKDCAPIVGAIRGQEGALLSNELGITMYLGGAPHLAYADEFASRQIASNPGCSLLSGLRLAKIQTELRAPPGELNISAVARGLREIDPESVPGNLLGEARREACRVAIETDDPVVRDQICEPLDEVSPEENKRQSTDLPSGTIQGVMHFRPGSVVLDDADVAVVQRLATYLDADPARRIWLKGRADSRGSSESNLWVSNERARAVRAMFLGRNARPDQIVVTPCGELAAAPPNSDDAIRARDRRVDLVVGPPQTLTAYVPSPDESDLTAPLEAICR